VLEKRRKQVAEEIKRERLRREWTQVKLSAESGVNLNLVRDVEQEQRMPSLPTLERLFAALELEVVWVFRPKNGVPSTPPAASSPEAASDGPYEMDMFSAQNPPPRANPALPPEAYLPTEETPQTPEELQQLLWEMPVERRAKAAQNLRYIYPKYPFRMNP
jgi:transcriptional regulator with XRE-family HTH domain